MGACCFTADHRSVVSRGRDNAPDGKYKRLAEPACRTASGESVLAEEWDSPKPSPAEYRKQIANSQAARVTRRTDDTGPTLLEMSAKAPRGFAPYRPEDEKRANLSRKGAVRKHDEEPATPPSRTLSRREILANQYRLEAEKEKKASDLGSRSRHPGDRSDTDSESGGRDVPDGGIRDTSVSDMARGQDPQSQSNVLVDIDPSSPSAHPSTNGTSPHDASTTSEAHGFRSVASSGRGSLTSASPDADNQAERTGHGATDGEAPSSDVHGEDSPAHVANGSANGTVTTRDNRADSRTSSGSSEMSDKSGHKVLSRISVGSLETSDPSALPYFATSSVPASGFTPPMPRIQVPDATSLSSTGRDSPALAGDLKSLKEHEEAVSFLAELGYGPGQVIERQMFDHTSIGEVELKLEVTYSAVNIEIVQLNDLKLMSLPRTTELYIKCYLQKGLAETSKHTKKRTKAVNVSENMIFDETLHFSMSPGMDVVKVMLWEEKLGRNPMYGMATIQLSHLDGNDGHSQTTKNMVSYRNKKVRAEGKYTLFGAKEDGKLGVQGLKVSTSTGSLVSVRASTPNLGKLRPFRHSRK
eukprot:scpid22835/ scgid33438/ 